MTHIVRRASQSWTFTSAAARYLVQTRDAVPFPDMIDDARIKDLFDAAARARANAHAPYSGFAVGAALMTEDGAIHAGCNVENAAYPVGACAEAGAISAMAAAGDRRIAAILVIGGGEALCTPCGACRQRMREFAGPRAVVVVAGPEGVRRGFTLGELLPESFGPDTLAKAPDADR